MSYPVDLDSRGQRRGEVKCSSTCYLTVRRIFMYRQISCGLAVRHEIPDLLLGWLLWGVFTLTYLSCEHLLLILLFALGSLALVLH